MDIDNTKDTYEEKKRRRRYRLEFEAYDRQLREEQSKEIVLILEAHSRVIEQLRDALKGEEWTSDLQTYVIQKVHQALDEQYNSRDTFPRRIYWDHLSKLYSIEAEGAFFLAEHAFADRETWREARFYSYDLLAMFRFFLHESAMLNWPDDSLADKDEYLIPLTIDLLRLVMNLWIIYRNKMVSTLMRGTSYRLPKALLKEPPLLEVPRHEDYFEQAGPVYGKKGENVKAKTVALKEKRMRNMVLDMKMMESWLGQVLWGPSDRASYHNHSLVIPYAPNVGRLSGAHPYVAKIFDMRRLCKKSMKTHKRNTKEPDRKKYFWITFPELSMDDVNARKKRLGLFNFIDKFKKPSSDKEEKD